jgi:uncharacterized protein YuzE
MDVSFDREADAVYIQFSDAKVDHTTGINARAFLDIDKNGEIIGIELLDASHRFDDPEKAVINITGTEQLEA